MSYNCADNEASMWESDVVFLGFALNECKVKLSPDSARYLRAIHRTALELATQNCFGCEIGGFWLSVEQIAKLRSLSEYYPLSEAAVVAQAIEAYLAAQLEGVALDAILNHC